MQRRFAIRHAVVTGKGVAVKDRFTVGEPLRCCVLPSISVAFCWRRGAVPMVERAGGALIGHSQGGSSSYEPTRKLVPSLGLCKSSWFDVSSCSVASSGLKPSSENSEEPPALSCLI